MARASERLAARKIEDLRGKRAKQHAIETRSDCCAGHADGRKNATRTPNANANASRVMGHYRGAHGGRDFRPASAGHLHGQREGIRVDSPQGLYPNDMHYASITMIEGARPWSRPSDIWDAYATMQGTFNTLRVCDSSKVELTSPYHISSSAAHGKPGIEMFTRRGRGGSNYARPRCPSATPMRSASRDLLAGVNSSGSLQLPLESPAQHRGSSPHSLGRRSPSLRSLRMESRPSTPSYVASRETMRRVCTPEPQSRNIPPTQDPMVAGIGFAEKFNYRSDESRVIRPIDNTAGFTLPAKVGGQHW